MPLFYGPYYLHVARTGLNETPDIFFALALSVMTSCVMIGIFNVEKALEDPFSGDGLDDVRVEEVIRHIQSGLNLVIQEKQ